jgi:hypothetical protein
MSVACASLSMDRMKRSFWGSALIVPLATMSLSCGGAAFTTDTDAGGGSSGGGSGSTSGGSSGGNGSSSGSGSGGGSTSGGGSSGGGRDGGGCGNCVDAAPPGCPAQAPTSPTSCSPHGLECEYGSSPVQGCDTVLTCNGTWQTQGPTDTSCGAPLDKGCPITFDAASAGGTCSQSGLVCNYPRGRCACGGGFGGPVLLVDGSFQGRWSCQDPSTAGCPIPRPSLGSACSQEGLFCDYGSCNVPGGSAEQCASGIWTPAAAACPVFAGAAQ